jgi:hypothetical protein
MIDVMNRSRKEDRKLHQSVRADTKGSAVGELSDCTFSIFLLDRLLVVVYALRLDDWLIILLADMATWQACSKL